MSHLMKFSMILCWIACSCESSSAEEPVLILPFQESLADLNLLSPPWVSTTITRESIIPLQFEENGPIIGRLAFPAADVLSVRSADGKKILKVGEDIHLSEDRLDLIFKPYEGLPLLRSSEFYPPPESPNSYRHRKDHPEQWMLYSQGHWWHDRQFEVTYRRAAADWPQPRPQLAEKLLPKTLEKLRAGKPLRIGVSGDSITAGLNASGVTGAPPYMPSWTGLVAMQLEEQFHNKIDLENRAVPGWSITHGIQDLEKLLEFHPDLMLVAYGMNDVGRRDPEWFRTRYEEFLRKLHELSPETEVILVSSMIGNQEWVHTPRDMFDKYRDVLASFQKEGIALADVTAVWSVMLAHKHHYDLTGNGLNHPNDCGNRLYAQTVLSLLVPPTKEQGK